MIASVAHDEGLTKVSQFVLLDVQEIKPTIQVDPLQLVLTVLYSVTAAAVIVGLTIWFGWRFVPQALFASVPSWNLLINIGLTCIPPTIYFFRVSAIQSKTDTSSSTLLRIFTLTLLVASAVGLPLIYLVLQPHQWLAGESTTNRILGYAMTVGLTQVAITYLLLRTLAWELAAIKHQVLIVSTTIGLAFACALSVAQAILFSPTPDAFVIRLVFQFGVGLLVASVVSYVLYQMRRDAAPIVLPVLVLAVTMVVIGLTISLRSGVSNAQITVTTVNARPLIGLLFSVALAILGAGTAWFLMKRQDRSKSSAPTNAAPIVYNFVDTLSFRQRWGHYLVLTFFVAALGAGFFLRDRTVNRLVLYEDLETGIRVAYPANWLIDRSSSEYVFRVRDMRTQGFKTTIQVSVIPIGRDTSERNVADILGVQRSRQLIDYRLLSVTPTTFNGAPADVVTYTFISRDPSPFLESVPTVVFGEDIIFFSREQAIVLTFRADATLFQEEYTRFQRFLNSLEL
jgi:hypothetical protein